MLQCFLIAITISMDGLSVGIAYGIKNITIPLYSLLVLDIISAILLSLGFFTGHLLIKLISKNFVHLLGVVILLLIGLWFLIQAWLNYKFPKNKISDPVSIAVISIDSLGIAINILRDPSKVDLDVSGIIDTKEAILLGMALSIDSLAIGVAVALPTTIAILHTIILVLILNLAFILLGIYIGRNCISSKLREKSTLIPGCLLIILGLSKLINISK